MGIGRFASKTIKTIKNFFPGTRGMRPGIGRLGRAMGGMAAWTGRHPYWTAGGFAAGVMGMSMGNHLMKTTNFHRPQGSGAFSMGPGYVSWSKASGMSPSHGATDGLTLSLSNMRHTSYI